MLGEFESEVARFERLVIGPVDAPCGAVHPSLCGSHSLPSVAFRCQARLLQQHRHFFSLIGRGAWDCVASIDAVGLTSRDGCHR